MKKLSNKLTAILLCSSLCLCGCSNEKPTESNYSIQTPTEFVSEYEYDRYDNGLLYHDGDTLCFLDYNTMQGTPVCNKPNCTHKDTSCIAKLCSTAQCDPVIYKDNAYYFTATDEIVDSENGSSQTYQIHTKCMRANLHSGEVETFAEFEGLNPTGYMKTVVSGNTLYFICSDGNPVQKDNGSWSYRISGGKQYLCSLNLDDGSFQQIGLINDSPYAKNNTIIIGNSVNTIYDSVEISGIYQDKIYMHYRYVENQQDLIEASETYGAMLDKLYDEEYVPWVVVNRCYDLNTGDLSTSDLPYAKVIADNTYVYWDIESEQYIIRDADNTEFSAAGMKKAYKPYLINGKLWSFIENEFYTAQCFDIEEKKVYPLKLSESTERIVMDYVNDKYIVREYNRGVVFSEMPEEDIIEK